MALTKTAKIILLVLSLASVIYASNIGAVSGGTSADPGNGIFFNSDLITAAQNVKANGAVIKADTAVTYDHTGNGNGERNFAKAGIGTDVIVGMYSLITGTNITSGYYEITGIAGDDSWVNCANITATDDNADSTLDIGGACPIVDAGAGIGDYELQDIVDDALGSAAANNVDIYVTGTGTLTATLDLDTGGGSSTTRKRLWACNTSYAYTKGGLTLTTTSTLANGLVKLTTEDYFDFYGIVFDGGGKDASRAVYCVHAVAIGDGQSNLFDNCVFTGASADGLHCRGYYTVYSNCEAYLNGGNGFDTVSAVTNVVFNFCSSHDNDVHGFEIRTFEGVVQGNISYDNGKDGAGSGFAEISSSTRCQWIKNTSFGNATDGFASDAASIQAKWINNTAVGNGAYGFRFNGSEDALQFLAYNHASVNTTAHTDVVADGAFANLKQGNNVNGSQAAADIFVSVADGSEDFTPKAGSDLIDAGLDVQGTPTADIGAIERGGGGLGPGTTNKSGGKQ